MKRIRNLDVCLATLVMLCSACGAVDDGSLEHDLTDEALGQHQDAIRNATESPRMAGVVSLAVSGQTDLHTGIQIGDRLVLTSSAWMNWQTNPSTVTVRFGAGEGSSGTAKTAQFVNSSAYFPAAIVQVPFTSASQAPAVDTRTGPQLVGAVLRCFEFSTGTRLRAVDINITSQSGNTVSGAPSSLEPGDLEASDLGAPCLDLGQNTVVGFVSAQSSTTTTIYRLRPMQVWFDGMENLAEVRASGDAVGPLAIYNTPTSTQKMCLDIPWGGPYAGFPVNQYPCHFARAQQFWLDFSVDSNNPRIVSEASGLCVDLPSAVTTDGQNFQQYPCHTGTNQRFDFRLYPDYLGGIRFQPLHARSHNRCLSVQGGPSTTSSPSEQRTCASGTTSNTDQRWNLWWL